MTAQHPLFTLPAVTERQRLETVRACFRQCVCAGQCGKSHKNWPDTMGRCGRTEDNAPPLWAIPAGLARIGGEPDRLVAVCDRCRHGLAKKQAPPQPTPPRPAAPGPPAELSLFPTCPVPACTNLVDDPREVCTECVAEFGPLLRPTARQSTAEEFAAAVADGDAAVRAVLAERRTAEPGGQAPRVPPQPGRKRNQLCWLCEQRRACRPDPDHPSRWICRECEAKP